MSSGDIATGETCTGLVESSAGGTRLLPLGWDPSAGCPQKSRLGSLRIELAAWLAVRGHSAPASQALRHKVTIPRARRYGAPRRGAVGPYAPGAPAPSLA